MSLATSDVGIISPISPATRSPIATRRPLCNRRHRRSANIDNGFGVQVEVKGEFNAIVPLLSSSLDGIDLTSSQNRSVFKGVVGG